MSDIPVNPTDLSIRPGLVIPGRMLVFRFDKSSGPGGQNVNKLATRATLTVGLAELATLLAPPVLDRLRQLAGHYLISDGLQFTAGASRSQHANRAECLEKLQHLVNIALIAPKKRRPTKRTYGSKQRRLEGKAHRQDIKRGRQRPMD